jgi:hypothetical protein
LVVSLEVSTAVLLMFQIITNVMLCHWVSSSWHLEWL